MNFDKLMEIDFAQLLNDIIDGIRRVFEFFKAYMPKNAYNFEDKDAEWNKTEAE